MRKLVVAFVLLTAPAQAQFATTTTTAPTGDSTSRIASTQFVQQNISSPTNLSAAIDAAFGSTRGSILERGASSWQIVPPSSTSGLPYVSNGTGSDPGYQLLTNAGLASMGARTLKGNLAGSTAAPTDVSMASMMAVSVLSAGVSGSGSTTTGTISATSNSLTLASAIDFANGQGIRINHAGAAFTLNQPTGGTVTPQGTTGATTYQYQIASLDGAGGVGVATSSFQTTTGNATLTQNNYNKLTWTAPTGTAPAGYAIYKNVSGTLTLIGIVNQTTFYDYGFTTFYQFFDWVPSAPQGSALADWLVTTISSGAGTTTLTLGATATTTATSQGVIHDDTAALQSLFSVSGNYYMPGGTYWTSSALNVANFVVINGIQNQTNFRSSQLSNGILQFASNDSMSGVNIFIAGGQNGVSYFSNQTVGNFQRIRCLGGAIGTQFADQGTCVNLSSNSGIIAFRDIMMDSWSLGGVAGVPPTILLNGTSVTGVVAGEITLDNIYYLNDGAAVLSQGGASIVINNIFNTDFSSCELNGQASNNGSVTTIFGKYFNGIQIEGGSQGVNLRGCQILNFGTDLRLDIAGGNSPIVNTVTNNIFDFCQNQCVALNAGGGIVIDGNYFVGEGNSPWNLTGNTGLAIGSSFGPGDANVFSNNSFNNYNGAGSAAISNAAALVGTTFQGNNYVNVNSPVIQGSGTAPSLWQTFSPAATCGTATFTTNTGRYRTIDFTTYIELDIKINALGTCTQTMTLTLPTTPNSPAMISGRDIAGGAGGNVFMGCAIASNNTTATCIKNAATAFIAGEEQVSSGIYENK